MSTSAKNITLRKANDLGLVSRKDRFVADPTTIIVNWDENPRKDFGTEEELAELKESIMSPMYVMGSGQDLHLMHGFRRMKVVLELVAEGVDIRVPVEQFNNMEEAMLAHFTLNNTSKPLNDLELGETLSRYAKLINDDNYQNISNKTGINYQKVVRLMNFMKEASSQIKTAVSSKEISMTSAIELVANTSDIVEQNNVLAEVKSTKKEGGKATHKHVKKAIRKTTGKSIVSDDYTYLWTVLEAAEGTAMNKAMQSLLISIEKGVSFEELVAKVSA